MIINAENLFGQTFTTTGSHIRLTQKGLFVDNVLWKDPFNQIVLLDIVEEKKT